MTRGQMKFFFSFDKINEKVFPETKLIIILFIHYKIKIFFTIVYCCVSVPMIQYTFFSF